jgi:hypothetical protein
MKWWFWAIVVIVVAVAASSGGGGGSETTQTPDSEQPATSDTGDSTDTSDEADAPAEPEEQAAGIGDPLKVGDLVFTVNDASMTQELKSPLGDKTGNWMIVTVTVGNESQEAVTIDSSFFKLIEDDGTTYETDSDNLMYLDADSNFFLEKINPKLEKTGKVLFAVPEGLGATQLQVQTGAFGTQTGLISLN